MVVLTFGVDLQGIVEGQLLAGRNHPKGLDANLEPAPSPAVLHRLVVRLASMVGVPGCVAAFRPINDQSVRQPEAVRELVIPLLLHGLLFGVPAPLVPSPAAARRKLRVLTLRTRCQAGRFDT